MMEMLAKFNPDNLGVADKLVYDRFILAQSKDMDSERRSEVGAIERAEELAELTVLARASGLFKAAEKFFKDTSNNVWVRLVIVREKNAKGEWEYSLGSKPSESKGENFLPGGKDLKFRFNGMVITNTVDNNGKTVDKPRGAKHAALALCKAITLNVGKDADGKGSSPGTAIRRQLELVDGDGNPAGLSMKRNELEKVEIQHPSISDGKWTTLTDFYFEWSNPAEEEEEADSEE
jgi:hypothetical protein